MAITYIKTTGCFVLSAGGVSYVMHVDDAGHLYHLYWGAQVADNAIVPDLGAYPELASVNPVANQLPWELPVPGAGYYGVPALRVRNASGDDILDLRVTGYRISAGKESLHGLPSTHADMQGEADSLELTLCDSLTGLVVTAEYAIFACGAVTRSLHLLNGGQGELVVEGLQPASVPLWGHAYDILHLKGNHNRERAIVRRDVGEAEYRIASCRGASGHEENPFVALMEKQATEHQGSVYALSFVYSGSFLAGSQVDVAGNTRLFMGMNGDAFRWLLEPGETLQSPEAVLVYSGEGLNGMSHVFHALYRRSLMRGAWRDRERPVLINNWEATYFDFDEEKLLSLAGRAARTGVELFVLDDGWFGRRNDDASSLGDWTENREKLPDGLAGLARKVNALGMRFGIWMEPEMVSPESDLYRAHPDWCLHVPGRPRTECRQQLMLDLSRREVQDHVLASCRRVLESAPIAYVKWDFNRNMTEAYSAALPANRQMETQHRYMLGLYRVLEELTAAFPEVLFESCAGGGGRFDPGMLFYMPQTWTSDNTDAYERLRIQYGTSLVYPAVSMGAHVSAVPNHATGRVHDMAFRADVALGGNFGLELDLTALTEEELEAVATQVARAKALRHLTETGTMTRLLSPYEGEHTAWQFLSADGGEALLCVYRGVERPYAGVLRVKMRGLAETAIYQADDGKVYSGAMLMHMGYAVLFAGRDCVSTLVHLVKCGE